MSDRKTLFNNYITEHLSHFRDPKGDRRYKKDYLVHNYKRFFPVNRDARILDIGPGYGELLEILVKDYKYTNVLGIDISPEVVDFCNNVIPNKTILIDDTLEFLSMHPCKFDCIFMIQVLEHIPKDAILPLLKNLHQSMTPHGQLILEVPNMSNLFVGLNARYADFTHEIGFTEMSMKYILQSSNFEHIEMYNSFLPFNHYARPIQFVVQILLKMMLRVIYKAYALQYPNVLSSNLCVLARKQILSKGEI